jgi:hypothetical protein
LFLCKKLDGDYTNALIICQNFLVLALARRAFFPTFTLWVERGAAAVKAQNLRF